MLDYSLNNGIAFLPEVSSTNKVLQDYISEFPRKVPEGAILKTDYQTKGKGQQKNTWESERGKNLMMSLVLYPDFVPLEKQFMLSKAVSLGIINALSCYNSELKLKWPNDIYFDNKKLGGILIETAIMGSQFMYAVIGIGINVFQDEFLHAPNAISLKDITAKFLNINHLIKSIRIEILKQYELLKAGKFMLISSDYFSKLMRFNQNGKFKDESGEFNAVIQSVEETGQLVLLDDFKQVRRYWMKEVEFLL